MQNDLKLISGEFLEKGFSNEYLFINKYFSNENAKMLIKYYMEFGEIDNFTNHTGLYETKKYLTECLIKFKKLIEAYNSAKDNFDLELMEKIKSGDFKFK